MLEVLKQALEALEEIHAGNMTPMAEEAWNKAITYLRKAIREHAMYEVQRLGQEIEQEPVGKLQEPTVERAWFTIAELNAWADKKLSENPHWVMPKDEPERNEPPPQRTWVGLTDEDELDWGGGDLKSLITAVEAKLKEKNT